MPDSGGMKTTTLEHRTQRQAVSFPSSSSHKFPEPGWPEDNSQAIKGLFAQLFIEATPPCNSSDPLIMQKESLGIFFSLSWSQGINNEMKQWMNRPC